jgi:hypothetical protein
VDRSSENISRLPAFSRAATPDRAHVVLPLPSSSVTESGEVLRLTRTDSPTGTRASASGTARLQWSPLSASTDTTRASFAAYPIRSMKHTRRSPHGTRSLIWWFVSAAV